MPSLFAVREVLADFDAVYLYSYDLLTNSKNHTLADLTGKDIKTTDLQKYSKELLQSVYRESVLETLNKFNRRFPSGRETRTNPYRIVLVLRSWEDVITRDNKKL